MENYDITKAIGQGSFGQVFLAKNNQEQKQYVIKKIKT
jgi:serine/threonine protein kinase